MIYLDHNATTPIAPEVRDAMLGTLDQGWGNPSSSHASGRRAKDFLETARNQVADFLGASPAQVTFTSGATEADNLAIRSAAANDGRRHFVCATLEHPAVIEACRALEQEGYTGHWIDPEPDGRVTVEKIGAALTTNVAFVALMLANNETGVIQPVADVARAAKKVGARVVCDAVQAAGKISFSVDELAADYVIVTAHKVYGPKGAGALWSADNSTVIVQQVGGSQERGLRGGTENVLGAVGLGAACALAAADLKEIPERMAALRDEFEDHARTKFEGVRVNGDPGARLPNTSNILFTGVEGEGLALALDLEGVCVSAGSACHSGAAHPSPVLSAMGLPAADALASIRVSFGRKSNADDLRALMAALDKTVPRLREAAS